MNKNIKWRLEYLFNALKYKPFSLLDFRFWILTLPEPIKNKFNLLSKKINVEMYTTVKKIFFNKGLFIFNITYQNKKYTIKYLEPESIGDKHSFVGEFFDIIYPYLIDEEKNKLTNLMTKLEKINFKKMAWALNKTSFHSVYYYPVLKNKKWLFEGEYFNSEFTLDKNSIVYDWGSHIGLFSIIAAKIVGDKGKVYAFEPSKEYNKYIQENAKLNNLKNIEIINVGVSNKNVTGRLEGMNFIEDKKGNLVLTTINKLCEDKKIKGPDFIKADIEGFERYALIGSEKVLKKYKPKLSLCVYHLKDDKKVIKEILKKINKNYKFKLNARKKKIFCYIN